MKITKFMGIVVLALVFCLVFLSCSEKGGTIELKNTFDEGYVLFTLQVNRNYIVNNPRLGPGQTQTVTVEEDCEVDYSWTNQNLYKPTITGKITVEKGNNVVIEANNSKY